LKVQIEENLFIESDGMQFIVKRYTGKIDKEGREVSNILGCFVNLATAVKHLVKTEIMKSQAETLSELVDDIKRIEAYIEDKITV
jgi:hypothetical protein